MIEGVLSKYSCLFNKYGKAILLRRLLLLVHVIVWHSRPNYAYNFTDHNSRVGTRFSVLDFRVKYVRFSSSQICFSSAKGKERLIWISQDTTQDTSDHVYNIIWA